MARDIQSGGPRPLPPTLLPLCKDPAGHPLSWLAGRELAGTDFMWCVSQNQGELHFFPLTSPGTV